MGFNTYLYACVSYTLHIHSCFILGGNTQSINLHSEQKIASFSSKRPTGCVAYV